MYKLMIVDDEESIRSGIGCSLPWQDWGYEVCALCENGKQAIEQLPTAQPDVVLSDIRMPIMDGLELMQYLHQNEPQIKVIILSGYSDFEYLNMSIKNKVTDYLLKPTDLDEFEAMFRKLKTTMDEERRSQKQVSTSVDRHFSKWVENLLLGCAEPEDTARFLPEAAQRGFYPENCVVVLFAVDDRSGDEEQSLYKFKRRILHLLKEQQGPIEAFFLLAGSETLISIFGAPAEETLEEQQLKEYIRHLQSLVKSTLSGTVSVGISNLCTELDMLPQACEQARCCAKQNIFQGSESLFSFSQMQESLPGNMTYFNAPLVEKCLLANDFDGICAEIDRVWAAIPTGPILEYHAVDQLALSLLFTISLWSLRHDVRMEDVFKSMGTTYTDVYRCDTLEKKKQFLYAILFALQLELERHHNRSRVVSSVAYQVREFVENNFTSNAMSLEYVADYVHKSPAYISKVFKNELGCNFIDYLTDLRIARAEELLANTEKKVYLIAEECGYADTSNFIRVFRRHSGMSPSEYRAGRRSTL